MVEVSWCHWPPSKIQDQDHRPRWRRLSLPITRWPWRNRFWGIADCHHLPTVKRKMMGHHLPTVTRKMMGHPCWGDNHLPHHQDDFALNWSCPSRICRQIWRVGTHCHNNIHSHSHHFHTRIHCRRSWCVLFKNTDFTFVGVPSQHADLCRCTIALSKSSAIHLPHHWAHWILGGQQRSTGQNCSFGRS